MNAPLPTADIEQAAGPSDKDLRRLVTLAREQLDLLKDIEVAERNLKRLNEALKANRESTLPTAMDEVGAASFSLSNGASIQIKQVVRAAITEANRPAAHAWLEANKHEALIKREIKINFGRDELSWAKKFMADMAKRKRQLKHTMKEWVDTNTLGAFVREQRRMAAQDARNPDEAVPKDLFGVYVARYAEVVLPEETP